ncbi:MAG: hypothetical protein C7B46_17090 [Sulfobacillus benefaciens]|uniref:Uncharacterized protein n=1 Tax=Sulfobacillus benefaciens TaxID=453960 RepID=A0A2T2X9P3_9FIRM|nr:MAG: hypothetical protein C7B46_17090 [Sulfobacillus benefaciens]
MELIGHFRPRSAATGHLFSLHKSLLSVGDVHTIATLRGDMERIGAALGVLITLDEPTGPTKAEAAAADLYHHQLFDLTMPRIQVVTVQDMLAHHATLTMPLTHDAVKAAQVANTPPDQLSWV